MRLSPLALLPLALSLAAQSPKALQPAKTAPKTAKPEPAAKDSLEAQAARQSFERVLDSVNAAWFGAPFKDIRYVELDGTLRVTLSASAINAKVAENTAGAVKANAVKEGRATIAVKSTYFANTDFRTEMSGDFGHLLYTRTGTRGFLYSKEQNAYTTRVEPAPSDAPLTFMGWFQQSLNDIKDVYAKATTFKASFGKDASVGGRELSTVTFFAPTAAYDVKQREQPVSATLGFWKRGKLEVAFDKATRLPYQMDFSNEQQGVRSRMDFNYDAKGKLLGVTIANNSRGFEGPGTLRVAYGPDGLPSSVNGELVSQQKKIAFDMHLNWNKGVKSIATVPPVGAAKKGREELETLLLVGAAGNILELQRNGLNFRAFSLAGAK